MTAVLEQHEWVEGELAALEELKAYLPDPIHEGVVLGGYEISVAFGGVQALKDVAIEIHAQQFVGLIGPNGAGKSTLFDVLNGFRKPQTGRVMLFGEDHTHSSPWTRASLGVGRTFQANHIDVDQTVFSNLLVGAHRNIRGGVATSVIGMPKTRSDERRAEQVARAVARLMGLELVMDIPARSLDFGAQRRIEIGRSLMSAPRLLFLDEPSAGFDSHESALLFQLVAKLQRDLGLAVLLVEHYVDAVLQYTNPIWVLDQGKLIAKGTPDEIVADAAVRAAYLGGHR